MNHKMKIKSDKYKGYMKHKEEMREGMSPEMKKMMGNGEECVPVDLYGKRVNFEKDNKSNLEKTAEDTKEYYGLDDY